MLRREYYKGPKYLDDLKDFDSSDNSIAIFGKAKNIERLKDLNISKLWLVGTNEKQLQQILSLTSPEFVNIYQILAKDLSILETLSKAETIVLRWNSKSHELWNMSCNKRLKALVIEDFQKISNINTISNARNLEYLVLEGGMWKPLKIDSLNPLSGLTKLQFLRLANMHVKKDGVIPISNLTNLKELDLSNQFETSDYAYLAAKLFDTKCDYFKPYIKLSRAIGGRDVMVIGKRKPFLNFEHDNIKIEKYVHEFDDMVKGFSKL
jgi:Leucine-rich repeat (LRR) protein